LPRCGSAPVRGKFPEPEPEPVRDIEISSNPNPNLRFGAEQVLHGSVQVRTGSEPLRQRLLHVKYFYGTSLLHLTLSIIGIYVIHK